MSSDSQNIDPMISTYKKLFLYLSIITILGIAFVFLRAPIWIVITVGLLFIIVKSAIVIESFKKLLIGRNSLVIIFGLTITFLIALLLLPALNHQGYLVGTEDTSKQLMMEQLSQPKEAATKEAVHGH
jgi:hypothetical protein